MWGKKKIIIKSVKKENSTAQAEFSEPSSDLIPNSEFNTRKKKLKKPKSWFKREKFFEVTNLVVQLQGSGDPRNRKS